jgi:hypothetical protein
MIRMTKGNITVPVTDQPSKGKYSVTFFLS